MGYGEGMTEGGKKGEEGELREEKGCGEGI